MTYPGRVRLLRHGRVSSFVYFCSICLLFFPVWIVSRFFFGWITFGRWACVFLVVCVSSFPFVVICGSRFPLRPARLHYWGCFWNFSHSCRVGTFETRLFVERWVSNSRNFVHLIIMWGNAHPHPNLFSIKASEAYDRLCLGIPFGIEPFGKETLLYPAKIRIMLDSHCLCLFDIFFRMLGK